ncbi:eL24 family ribosomal protein [Caproicibacter fermentans]|uniref:TRASH domain-containing protein n=1 Tax=Caproicibacter fermentans TaxID=2576756 RepID=A0A7G8TB83_9FIRM|nr:TRASH domain-containing protein [Caproicibacter fermentans]QNK40874.1 TRASH domain-containing protein [Caproicibacter fermentans]
MSGKRAGKKRAAAVQSKKIESVRGERCVYCGKPLEAGGEPFEATVKSRRFHTCCASCKEATERYVLLDKRKKVWLYLTLLLCAAGIIISAMGAANLFMYGSILLAGIGFLAFPYPITTFETFLSCPIQRVTVITRAVGALLSVLGLLFLLLAH